MPHTLLPEAWTQRARRASKEGFLEEYAESRLLLVRLSRRFADLATYLEAYSTSTGATIPPPAGYHTAVSDKSSTQAMKNVLNDFDAKILSTMLKRHSYFVAPTRKRTGVSKPFEDRVSVGRARNNDIVLRDESVSKFHAWFERNDEGVFYIVDADSTNSTLLNGKPVTRTPQIVRDGDEIRFGSVPTTLCHPETFWDALART